jgi:hypothetical protein
MIAGGTTTNAADAAADPAYTSSWDPGSNGGSGFLGWQFYNDANAGRFISAQHGFGFWSHESGDNLSEAVRPFASALAPMDTFRVRMKNGWIWENGGSVGVALRNSEGDTLWQLYFNGGTSNYVSSAGITDIDWTDAGLDVAFTVTGAGAYSVSITPVGGMERTYTGTFSGSISQFRAWSYKNGTADDYNSNRDFFVNLLAITSPVGGGIQEHSDSVVITRQAGGGQPEHPVIGGVARLGSGPGGMQFALESSTPGATYALWESPTLFPSQNWQRIHASATQGQGGILHLDLTNLPAGSASFYRIGVLDP